MKKLNKLVVALTLALSLNAHASALKIESVVLKDGSIIGSDEISAVHIFKFINTVDYIELKEGTRIESTEIKEVNFQNLSFGKSSNPKFNFQAGAKTGGDGSGG